MGMNCFYFTALSHSDGAIIYKVAVTYCVSVGSASCSLTSSAPPESHFPNPTGGINTTEQNKNKKIQSCTKRLLGCRSTSTRW